LTEHEQEPIRTEIELVRQALKKGKRKRIRKLLRGMHPAKVASLLESFAPVQRLAVWQQVDDAAEQEVLAHISEALQGFFREDAEVPGNTTEAEARTELARLRDALESGKLKRVGRMLQQVHPAKAAGLLESLPPSERSAAWEMVKSEAAGHILAHLHDEVRTRLALAMDAEDLRAAARRLDLDDLVDLIQDLPDKTGQDLLQAMDAKEREKLESMLTYPEDSAGGLMNTDQISVRADLRLGSVLRYLRLLQDLPDNTDKVMVVDRDNHYLGVLRLKHLLTSRPEQRVQEVMDDAFPPIPADIASREVAHRFEELDLVSAPVIDAGGRLLGRITVDDVVDVIREESDRSLMHTAGLDDEDDMFAPVLTSTRRRAIWLGVNLVGSSACSRACCRRSLPSQSSCPSWPVWEALPAPKPSRW
jgi:magnesium transporter